MNFIKGGAGGGGEMIHKFYRQKYQMILLGL